MRTSPFVKRGYSASSSVSCFITSASCLSNLSRSDWVGFFPFVPSIKSIILNRSAFRISLLSITSCSVDTSSPLSQFPHYLFSPLANIELTFYNCSILKGGYMSQNYTVSFKSIPNSENILFIISLPSGDVAETSLFFNSLTVRNRAALNLETKPGSRASNPSSGGGKTS